jgi:hypothetical protein
MSERIVEKVINIVRHCESVFWDRWMNVETSHSHNTISGVQGMLGDSFGFQTNAHYTIRKIIRIVKPSTDDIIVVMGCGKGRALSHFARLRVNGVIGIEISPELSAIAEGNMVRLRGKKAPTRIINTDAVVADLSEGSVFYMFNPFGEKTLHSVLKKLELSHKPNGKQLTIIYVNPKFSSVFNYFSWLEKTHDITSFAGLRTIIYKANYKL